MPSDYLNVKIGAALKDQLKIEAVRAGKKLHEYVAAILKARKGKEIA